MKLKRYNQLKAAQDKRLSEITRQWKAFGVQFVWIRTASGYHYDLYKGRKRVARGFKQLREFYCPGTHQITL